MTTSSYKNFIPLFMAIHDLVIGMRFLNGFTNKMEGLFTKVLVDVEIKGETPRRDSGDEISETVDEVLMRTIVFHMFCLPSSWIFFLTNHVKKREKIHITQQSM